jgi:hypothetical protein
MQAERKSRPPKLSAGTVSLLFAFATMALEIVALLSWRDGDPLELAVVGSAVAAIAAVIAGVFALKRAGAGERRRIQLSLTLASQSSPSGCCSTARSTV